MTTSAWNPDTNYVQQGVDNRRFINAQYSLLAAGPHRLAALGAASALAGSLEGSGEGAIGEVVHPLGIVQQFSLAQNKQFMRFFEIGSSRSYFLPGRAMGQMSIGRVLMHGPTLMRMFYSTYQDKIGPVVVDPLISSAAVAGLSNPHDVIVPPGYENIYLNLGSDLTDQHFGLLWYIKDNDKRTMGALYFESVNMPSHQIQTDAQGLVVMESASLQYDRIVPVKMGNAVPLISARTPNVQRGFEDGYPGLGGL
jgi:hypothetical protein